MLERVTVNALGQGGLEFNPEGLLWTCIIEPEHLVEGDEAAQATPKQAAPKQQAAAHPELATGRLTGGERPYTRLPALQLQKSRPSSRMNFASTILCTSSAPSTRRAARAAR